MNNRQWKAIERAITYAAETGLRIVVIRIDNEDDLVDRYAIRFAGDYPHYSEIVFMTI